MALKTSSLHPRVGVEIRGVECRRVDEATFADIACAFEDHSVLLFRGQRISDEEQVAFSERFGPLETSIRTVVSQARFLPQISNLANVDAEDRLIGRGDTRNLFNAGNQMWHSDSSFKRVPALASLLSAREVPPAGGETEFASMRVGYEQLPDATRQGLEGKVAIHSFVYSRGLIADGFCRPITPHRSRRSRRPWCGRIPRTAARRSSWDRTPARSSGCPRPKPGPCCVSCSRWPRARSGCTRTAGSPVTS